MRRRLQVLPIREPFGVLRRPTGRRAGIFLRSRVLFHHDAERSAQVRRSSPDVVKKYAAPYAPRWSPSLRMRRDGPPCRGWIGRAGVAVLALGLSSAPGASPRPACADGTIALDQFFKGAVVGLDGSKVKLRYDFSTKDQAQDWPQGVVFRLITEASDNVGLAEGKLAIRGSTGVHHVGEWEGDLTVTCKLVPDGTIDIGSWLGSNEQPDDCVTFTIGEKYFHGWDNKPGGDTGMMKFGRQYSATAKAGFVGFRYLQFRRPTTDPVPGKPVSWTFGRKGDKLVLTMDDVKLDSNEPPNQLKLLTLGFYAVKSSFSVDDVVVEGTLSSKFVANKKLALRTERPIVAEAASGLDPAVVAAIEAYQKDSSNPTTLVKIVSDAARPEPDRAAAAAALKAGPRRAMSSVVDLLYNAEVKVRQMGIDIVKSMVKKTYGYDPKASEKARGAAVRRLQEDIAAHPELLEGQGG